MMKTISSYRPEDIFTGARFLTVEGESVALASSFNAIEAKKVAAYFTSFIAKIRSGQFSSQSRRQAYTAAAPHQLQTASLFLQAMIKRYDKKIHADPNLWKNDDFLKTLVKLDRYLAAIKFSSLTNKGDSAMTQETVEKLFTTEGARSSLQKWLSLKTHKGIKGQVDDVEGKLINSDRATEAFLSHPEEVDFIQDKAIFKHISRLNDHIELDSNTLSHQILCEGKRCSVSDVMKRADRDSMTYREGVGLTKFNGENWQELPIYRKRKNAKGPDDYKFIIKTLNVPGHQHAWIELKTPEDVYNIGYAWASGSSIGAECGYLPSLETIPGTFSVPDREELSGKDDKFVKTSCRITKEQFEALKGFIETSNLQKPIPYNLTANNCCTFVREIGDVVGLKIGSKENGMRFLSGDHFRFRFSKSSILGKIERSFHMCLATFRNFLFYLFGAARSQLPGKKGVIFNEFKDILDPKKGLYDYPMRIFEWQEAVRKYREEEKEKLVQSERYQSMTEEDQQKALAELMIALPRQVSIEEPEDTL